LPVQVRRALDRGARFVYAYYDGVDRAAHAHGLEEIYEAELRAADRMVADVLDMLPPGAALAVTADHGQVQVGPRVVVLDGEVMDGVERLSGEGRFRWLHARRGTASDVVAAAQEIYAATAWVRTLDQLLEEGWLGPSPPAGVRARLGDVALVPFESIAFLDPSDTGEQRQAARHGSVTADEMLVPLLGWAPAR
jgi:predicted AlkP superfamily pyrophosphatase or phosphodiesterase